MDGCFSYRTMLVGSSNPGPLQTMLGFTLEEKAPPFLLIAHIVAFLIVPRSMSEAGAAVRVLYPPICTLSPYIDPFDSGLGR